jgi:hypothetical protein
MYIYPDVHNPALLLSTGSGSPGCISAQRIKFKVVTEASPVSIVLTELYTLHNRAFTYMTFRVDAVIAKKQVQTSSYFNLVHASNNVVASHDDNHHSCGAFKIFSLSHAQNYAGDLVPPAKNRILFRRSYPTNTGMNANLTSTSNDLAFDTTSLLIIH